MPDRGPQAWFAPKRFGYGAGLPIAWQGWVFMLVHLAILVILPIVLEPWMPGAVAIVLLAAFLPLPVYAARTRGGWRWRSGKDPD